MNEEQIRALSLNELREHGGNLADQIQTMSREAGERRERGEAEWPQEHQTRWDAVNDEFNLVEARHEELQREQRDAERVSRARHWQEQRFHNPNSRPSLDEQATADDPDTFGDLGFENRDQARRFVQEQRDRSLRFQSWAGFAAPSFRMTDEHREACERGQFNPQTNELQLCLPSTDEVRAIQALIRDTHPERRRTVREQIARGEHRALASLTGASGGFITVPSTVVRSMQVAMLAYGVMLEVAETIVTDTGEEMGWPYADDTSNEGDYIDENVDMSGDVDPGFEAVVWRSYEFHSKFIKVPNRLFRDSFIDLEMVIGSLAGTRIGRKQSGEATTGKTRVRGIVPRSALGNTAAGAAAITYDDVIDLEHGLDPDLREGAEYMFHDIVLKELRKLKDDQSRPLWQSNLREGVPSTFNGHVYRGNQKMASSIASGNKTMLFGQLSEYKWRQVGPATRLVRLVERYAEFGQTAFDAFASGDGDLLRPNAAASCPVVHLLQP